MIRYESRSVGGCLKNGASRSMVGLVMRGVARGAGRKATYGRNEKVHDQRGRSKVAEKACFPRDSSVVTGNKFYSPNGPCVEERAKA